MKKTNRLLLGIGAVAAVGLIVYAYRRHQNTKRYRRVADEGYETADDVLFPQRSIKGRKLQYGPVLPE